MGQLAKVSKLAGFAILGQFIAYLLSVVLARQLSIEDFEAYAVASATFIMMVMLVSQGFDKFALRLLPALFERGDWSLARRCIRFCLRQELLAAIPLALLVGCWAVFLSPAPSATRMAIIAACLSLPGGVIAHYGYEVLSATGRSDLAIPIFRIVVPLGALVLVGVIIAMPLELSGALATASWGVAWVFAAALFWLGVMRNAPAELWLASPCKALPGWRAEARPFWFYRLALAMVSQIGVLGLDILQPSAEAVGAYAAAMATASLPLVLATATNRSYSQRLAILLEQKNYAGILAVRRERLRWLLPAVAVFLIAVFGFAEEILGLFRPEFIDDGAVVLKIIAVPISISILHALAPTYMKYMGHNRRLLKIGLVAVGVKIFLLLLLVPRFAATGAAVAYSVSVCFMYGVHAVTATLELRALQHDTQSRH